MTRRPPPSSTCKAIYLRAASFSSPRAPKRLRQVEGYIQALDSDGDVIKRDNIDFIGFYPLMSGPSMDLEPIRTRRLEAPFPDAARCDPPCMLERSQHAWHDHVAGLRSRVIAVVEDGMSCNAAAARFGIAVSSAVRWMRAWRAEGRATALPQGGDLRSHHFEAYRDVILAAVQAEVDITRRDRRAAPSRARHLVRVQHGLAFSRSP